jgi:hypothetical protein
MMMTGEVNRAIPRIDLWLGGEVPSLRAWLEERGLRSCVVPAMLVVAGAGLYGASMGVWRAPLQAVYVAVKLPLILLLTAGGNALLNAMLAPLLGLNLPFRQSFLAILLSLALAGVILGAFSPLSAFLVWNAPPLGSRGAWGAYAFIQLFHVGVIAFAGVAANLFLGSQLSWILRPFIGSPGLEVAFLRPDAFRGNFFEAVFRAALHLLN